MKITNLASTPFDDVISCFLSAFQDYFVQLPEDRIYWKKRFISARVNWALSFGMFDGDNLVGFIINGIDRHNGRLTAYNTGTGVLAGYRGKDVVDQLYQHALPFLRQKGIEKCLLEVICENKRGIRVYERIGFGIIRKLRTFAGAIPENDPGKTLQKCTFQQVLKSGLYKAEHNSWDNTAEAVKVLKGEVQIWCLKNDNSPEGYLVKDLAGNILQLESRTQDYDLLLLNARALAKEVKLKNVASDRAALIHTLEKWHFTNPVNQYEMEMFLK